MRGMERDLDGGRRRSRGDKYIFVLCLRCGRCFSFNVSGKERGVLSRGDCHQFMSWHLNHPLQIWVFEMQIQLRMPRQIKRHTHTHTHGRVDKKTLLKTYPFTFFISRVCIVKHSLLSLFAARTATRADNAAYGKRQKKKKGMLIYLFAVMFTWQREREKTERCCFYLALSFTLCTSQGVFDAVCACYYYFFFFFLFFFHKTQWENMIQPTPPHPTLTRSISLTLQLFKHQ